MPNSNRLEKLVRKFYIAWIRPRIKNQLNRQRFKMLWFSYGYYPIFLLKTLTLERRIELIARFLKVDWNIIHAHRPCEIACICNALAERQAKQGEVMVEAGCWQGGSSSKFSIICSMLGYKLYIYDSFSGVEKLSTEDKLEKL